MEIDRVAPPVRPLLPNNSVLVREVCFDEREYAFMVVTAKNLSFLEGVLSRVSFTRERTVLHTPVRRIL